ncbi:magnesium chelatase, H subunit [Rhodomicrobium vannielii ATCC 17100]|uniref:magnesium chelatase n=2 Tax=Rhodomicrobium TaxID=1068 RepID=E3I2I6_RHOVT|nr:magnesium chelatase subunit H [Rhodomicrobium vannielii]ADP70270.1 magnesium chelatase, H subunit [Rhodomicrobium vannielii ATCC 17100]
MQKRTSAASSTPVRFVIVTLDSHLASAVERAKETLADELPGLRITLHAASEWGQNPELLDECLDDIREGDIILTTMLFIEEHIKAVLPALEARRDHCDAMIACMSASEVARVTKMGGFNMDGSDKGVLSLLKKLKPKKKEGESQPANAGAKQMAMLRRLPKILRFIPGAAQDVRAYFLTLQYWLAGSDDNIAHMVRYLVNRYASGPRQALRGKISAAEPVEYPEVGVYHPTLKHRVGHSIDELPHAKGSDKGTVGVLVMRSYVLAGNSLHYDGMIETLEKRGLNVIPVFASGLDAREAIERYFIENGSAKIDALVSLTGFSLVGGPAYNDAKGAQEILAKLDVPYISVQPVEFQTLQQWAGDVRGLMPVESTMMVAIPELDGATGPAVFGGRSDCTDAPCSGCELGCVFPTSTARDMHSCVERAEMISSRIERLIALRKSERAERKLGVVMFCFPPNAGNIGTAMSLAVFESLYNTLTRLKAEGYTVEVPESVDALRERVIGGNSARYGTPANVLARIPVNDYIRAEKWLPQIEKAWGSAPGRQQTDGATVFVLGETFGNVFVGIQPAMGYEGDPMRLLFERGFAPTHAFSAFYRWLRDDFGVHALLHFGTHGALEFMPGKQTGLSGDCWPDRLIGDLPNFYLYAANNPSEGTLAKRRSAATVVSYLTPPVTQAGLYRGLLDLKASVQRWREFVPDTAEAEKEALATLIQAQAAAVDLAEAEPQWPAADVEGKVAALINAVIELEETLIPHGLHVVGKTATDDERRDLLTFAAEALDGFSPPHDLIRAVAGGQSPEDALKRAGLERSEQNIGKLAKLAQMYNYLGEDAELPAIVRALDARYIKPVAGGDIIRNPDILPTGRNIHGFDPFRIPSVFAMKEGEKQAARLLDRHMAEGNALPESVAFVLWGTDNLKTEGEPIAQALALMGARPRLDSYGRVSGASLVPLEELGRPRIDVVMTMSGIFRDLLPLQMKLLAEASYEAAIADEPLDKNFIRKHALAYQASQKCDMETAALRVFSNGDGAYGANVNLLVDSGAWQDEDELAETYSRRKSFAYGRQGKPMAQPALLKTMLADVDLAYQNLDSVDLGVTTIDQYFDTLGGITRSVRRAKGGKDLPVYIADQTRGEGKVRTLSEQVSLETRTRALNPKWYEGMLEHGYEGVRQIEATVTNTMGWSATTGQVDPWVYQRLTQTYVLDETMRKRLAALNPTATARMVNRLNEAYERNYWKPDDETLDALRKASEELEDQIEGVGMVEEAA